MGRTRLSCRRELTTAFKIINAFLTERIYFFILQAERWIFRPESRANRLKCVCLQDGFGMIVERSIGMT